MKKYSCNQMGSSILTMSAAMPDNVKFTMTLWSPNPMQPEPRGAALKGVGGKYNDRECCP